MKYYIIAGEASGDLHGSNLIKELKKLDKEADFRCWGGDLMEKEGANIVKYYKELAFMGFIEVIMNLRKILKNISFCKEDIIKYKPDVIILIDYPGFNLRIAEFAKAQGFKVCYYISPQVWAWKQKRVHKIKHIIDRMFVILPFEKEFYKKFGYDVDFVGHPLLDAIDNNQVELNKSLHWERPVIAVLPGSRKQEVAKMLPVMLELQEEFAAYQFVIAATSSISPDFYSEIIKNRDVGIVYNKTYDLLRISKAAIVTSGTATLETALFEVPEVVCYKANYLSYKIAKSLIKVKYISLVNLVMNKKIVNELIQNDFNKNNLMKELKLLFESPQREELINNYRKLKSELGGKGASQKTAKLIIEYLSN